MCIFIDKNIVTERCEYADARIPSARKFDPEINVLKFGTFKFKDPTQASAISPVERL